LDEELIGRLAANMKLAQFCGFDLIKLELNSKTKDDVIVELSEILAGSHNVLDVQSAYKALLDREKLASTGMGLGVAVPHGRTSDCKGVTIAFGRSKDGIDFAAFDGQPVYLFFAILVPITAIHLHLQILASLSIILRDPNNRKKLMEAQFPQEVLDFLNGQ
jgi:nitrogen PTS system EIIA component